MEYIHWRNELLLPKNMSQEEKRELKPEKSKKRLKQLEIKLETKN